MKQAALSPASAEPGMRVQAEEAEALFDEMIASWSQGQEPDILGFLRRHPELAGRRELVIDAAYEEYLFRAKQGQRLPPEVFAARFPALKSSLCSLLAADKYVNQDSPEITSERILFPQPGTAFLGFHLKRELGRGAFARVYLAQEIALGQREVVVKVSPEGEGEVEADILGRLNHENIVPIHSLQRDTDRKLTALCMPFLGRATLCDLLDQVFYQRIAYPASAALILQTSSRAQQEHPGLAGQKPDRFLQEASYVEGIIHLGVQIARALASVHQHRIYHRDLKPSNVLLTPAGKPMLLDFNLSFAERGQGPEKGGTLAYMAPEQLAALVAPEEARPTVDGQADLYGLGLILFELLSGRHPFDPIPWDLDAVQLHQFLTQQQAKPLPALEEVLPAGPTEKKVAAVVRRCLAHDPRERFASAAELETALQQCLPPRGRVRRWLTQQRRLTRGVLCGVLGLSLLAGGGFAVRPNARNDQVYRKDRIYQEGVQAYYLGDLEKAVECFTQALKAKVEPTRALFARARAYQKLAESQKQWDKWLDAMKDYEALAQQDKGQLGRTAACLGYCYHQKDSIDYEKATINYLIALKSGYANAAVYNNLGYCCLNRSTKFSSAENYLRMAMQFDPGQQAPHYNFAVFDLRKSAKELRHVPEEGLRQVKEAIRLGPPRQFHYYDAARLSACIINRSKAPTGEMAIMEKELFDMLGKAIEAGYNPSLTQLGNNPNFQRWHADPRFLELLNRPGGLPILIRQGQVIDPVQGFGE